MRESTCAQPGKGKIEKERIPSMLHSGSTEHKAGIHHENSEIMTWLEGDGNLESTFSYLQILWNPRTIHTLLCSPLPLPFIKWGYLQKWSLWFFFSHSLHPIFTKILSFEHQLSPLHGWIPALPILFVNATPLPQNSMPQNHVNHFFPQASSLLSFTACVNSAPSQRMSLKFLPFPYLFSQLLVFHFSFGWSFMRASFFSLPFLPTQFSLPAAAPHHMKSGKKC